MTSTSFLSWYIHAYALLELLFIRGLPPVVEIAFLIELTSLVVEAMRDLMPDSVLSYIVGEEDIHPLSVKDSRDPEQVTGRMYIVNPGKTFAQRCESLSVENLVR